MKLLLPGIPYKIKLYNNSENHTKRQEDQTKKKIRSIIITRATKSHNSHRSIIPPLLNVKAAFDKLRDSFK
jgi:hypothetical protein